MPKALRRRLLERAVGRVRDRSGGIDAALDRLDRVDGSIVGESSYAVAQGIEIRVLTDRLVIRRSQPNGDITRSDDDDPAH